MIRLAILFVLAALPALAADLPCSASGMIRPELTLEQICQTKWGKDARAVTAAMKRRVFRRDALTPADCTPDAHGRRCEVDHHFPRDLAGADDERNLCVMSYGGEWNATMKDRLEVLAHQMVCRGDITLAEGRSLFLDWKGSYVRYFGQPP